MKVVINDCFGGFSLSHEAMLRYGELKGYVIYPEQIGSFATMNIYHYWIVPPKQRPNPLPEPWGSNPIEDRKEYNRKVKKSTLDNRPNDRADSALVQTVEELGRRADGEHASLKIVEIPDDVNWQIEEYDGMEWVAEAHRVWE